MIGPKVNMLQTPSLANITNSQQVVFFPTFGHLDEDGQTWNIAIRGSVFEPDLLDYRRRLLVRVLRRLLDLRESELNSDIFKQRVGAFLTSGEAGKRIVIRVGSQTYHLKKKSNRNGHFSGKLRLSAEEAGFLELSGQLNDGWLQFDTTTTGSNAPNRFFGKAQLISETGISVISDIDDTIKHTNVLRRRSLLTNTFLRKFQPIPGISELYRSWAEQGAAFHYVSSSPWQLYQAIADHCHEEGLPEGTFHLRSIRFRDPSIFRLFVARRWRKRRVIMSIFRTFPSRSFLLVGDSGEKDPEIYGAIARKFPHQVKKIYIRQLKNQSFNPLRYGKAFRHLPRDSWKIFQDPGEIPQSLSFLGVSEGA